MEPKSFTGVRTQGKFCFVENVTFACVTLSSGELSILPSRLPLLTSGMRSSVLHGTPRGFTISECLTAFLNDIYLVSQPERTAIAHRELGHQLWTRAGISLHAGKTQIWNNSGRCPPGCEGIFEAARVAVPNAVVWKGDQTLPTDRQGVVVGQDRGAHSSDLQCALLLLLLSAARRVSCFLRVAQPQSDSRLLTMRTCGIAPRSCWTLRGQ